MTSKLTQIAQSASDSHAAGWSVSGALGSFSWWAKVSNFLPASIADAGICISALLALVLIRKHWQETQGIILKNKHEKLKIKETRLKIKELENA